MVNLLAGDQAMNAVRLKEHLEAHSASLSDDTENKSDENKATQTKKSKKKKKKNKKTK